MSYDRFLYIVEICYVIKPKNTKIRFVSKLKTPKACGEFYINSNGIRTCAVIKTLPWTTQAHTLIHEVCHSLTYKSIYLTKKGKRVYYLWEYTTEKLARKFMREYELWDILEISDNWLLQLANSEEDENYYRYMARRIIREEKICPKKDK